MCTLDTIISLFTRQNIVDVTTIGAGIATAVSAFLGLQALREVRKQREASYKPELVLSGGEFRIYNLPTTVIPFPASIPWEYSYKNQEADYHATISSSKGRIIPLPINIYNIGLGAAKNVIVSCETNYDEWLDIFNGFSGRVEGELPFIIAPGFNNAILAFRSAEFVGVGSRTLTIGKVEKVYNHILPSSIEKNPQEFVLPYAIFYFLSAFTYIDFHTQNSKKPSYKRPSLPVIYFTVDYSDISDKKISKKFAVNFKGPSNSVALFSGVTSLVEVKEVKS